MIKITQITSGTKEYAPSNVNLYSGCPRDCRYCYAKIMAVIRFKRKTWDTWKEMELNEKAIFTKKGNLRSFRKRSGRIMFPSSHDITKENLKYCILMLRRMLRPGNNVLIVSKPDLYCINEITNELNKYRSQIEFRFTITSKTDYRLRFWEPNAPNLEERLQSLFLARAKGFKTSISMEPLLDRNPIPLILKILKTDPGVKTIWIGKMNYIGILYNANGDIPNKDRFFKFQRKICSWSNIQEIIASLKNLPENVREKIRLKDSIRNMYKRRGLEVPKLNE